MSKPAPQPPASDALDSAHLSPEDIPELDALAARINAILPPQYQSCYDSVQPVSMGSAGLKFGADGKVAWDEIWTSFCDLALAGGPPHRGTLLEPASSEECLAEPEKYSEAVEEIGRGLWMVSGLPILPRTAPGWVGVVCRGEAMAAWLVRAIVVENVSARQEQNLLYLPAGPQFRLAKEIKNVVTALAKTDHYWTCHMSPGQQAEAAMVMNNAAPGAELLEPPSATGNAGSAEEHQSVAQALEQTTGLPTVTSASPGWTGLRCTSVAMAIWLMRAILLDNVLVRREQDVLLLPACSGNDRVNRLVQTLARAVRLWRAHIARSASDQG